MRSKEGLKRTLALLLSIIVMLTSVPVNGIMAQSAVRKVKRITLNYSSAAMIVGDTMKLKVKKIRPVGASKKVTWKTSKKNVATVTKNGRVKARTAGTVKIIARSKKNSKIKAVCKLTIYKKTKELQLFSQNNYVLSVGDSVQLSAQVLSPKSKTEPIKWQSDNTEVAQISSSGMVTAINEGSAVMTAASGKKSVSVYITVQKLDDKSTITDPIIAYSVTFDTEGGSFVNSQTLESGKSVIKPSDPIREGYSFGGWYSDSSHGKLYDFSSAVTRNIILYAKWNKKHTVIFNTNGGTAIENQTIENGKTVVKPYDPTKTGYAFEGWYIDSSLTTRYDFSTAVIGDITIYAKWNSSINQGNHTRPVSPVTHLVTFDTNGGSEIVFQNVKEGQQIIKPDDPIKDGFTFIGWYTDSELNNPFDFSNKIMSDLILYAKWDKNEITQTITREEWITALSDLLKIQEASDGQHSFDDHAEAKNPAKIETAIRSGFLKLSADGDNMVYFKPQENATREFIAYTAIHALEYQIDEQLSPDWEDAADLSYPTEDLMAINIGILKMNGKKFFPNSVIQQNDMENALIAIKNILKQASINDENHGEVNYADGVQENELVFEKENDEKKIYVSASEEVKVWKEGEVHVIKSSDGTEKDLAIKIKQIYSEGDKTVIIYEEPALEEVVTSFDLEGKTNEGGTFIPAEGVSVDSGLHTRAVTSGEIPLFGKKNLTINIKDGSFSGSVDFKNLEYRFAASPSWHIITIDEIYFALNVSSELYFSYKKDVIFEPIKRKLGTVMDVPLGYGFFVSGDIYLIAEAKGGVEVGFELTQKTGIQYAKNNGIRPIHDMSINPILNLKAEAKGGLAFELGVDFLGLIQLATAGIEGGLAAEGTVENINIVPPQFCLDASTFIFLTIYGQIGPDNLNLRIDREIFNSDNSIWKKDFHFEETGKVDECTRGTGDYEGYVKRADNEVPIHNAKVQIIQSNHIKDTTYTDSHGHFKGIKLRKGSYKIRVSASGFRSYEQTFQIVGGQTTALETQLMIANENELTGKSCSGTITDAYTGNPIASATITVYSKFFFGNGDMVAKVTSGTDGSFSFSAPIGNYEVTIEKDGYVENKKDLIIIRDRNDLHISLSPKNQPVVEGNLRAVLHWGEIPKDLDSHMVGPEQDGMFHVFYNDKMSEHVNLDVDDVDGYGPETISISETEDGTYSYYVHDFTNKESSSSADLSNSGAYVDLYSGNTLLYKISIPVNQKGTVWHVFDYNSQTNQIQLVNEFSYQSNPNNVGMNTRRKDNTTNNLKYYEKEQ